MSPETSIPISLPTHPLLRPLVIKSEKRWRKSSKKGCLMKEWAKEFLNFQHQSVSRKTFNKIDVILSRLVESTHGSTNSLTPTTLLAYLRTRVTKGKIGPSTLALERVYLNKFFEWCKLMGYIKDNPLDPIPHVPVPRKTRQTVSEEEYQRLKEAARGTYWSGLLVVGWVTGARISDVCSMRWWDGESGVNLDTKVWIFTPIKTKSSGLQVELPLFGELYDELKVRYEVRDPDEPYVFPTAYILCRRGDGSIQEEFVKLRNKANVPKSITFHCLRHTRASRMLNSPDNPMDPITVANILGLSSLDTLRRYTHTSVAKKAQGMKL